MKQINNQSQVFLSKYDDSDLLLPVSEEYKNMENVCVAVKFGDIVVKISPKNTCQCSWDEAMNEFRGELAHPEYWQVVGSMPCDVNQALEILGHDPLKWVWVDEDNSPQYSGLITWYYNGPYENLYAAYESNSGIIRVTKVLKLS